MRNLEKARKAGGRGWRLDFLEPPYRATSGPVSTPVPHGLYETLPDDHIRLFRFQFPQTSRRDRLKDTLRRTASKFLPARIASRRVNEDTAPPATATLPGLDPDIECDMRVFPVGVTPPYIALSYCCGERYNGHFVSCCGQPRELGRNLLDFLRTLYKYRCADWIWVDALCINQANDLEKGHQIRLMAGIYSNARKVVAWLDDPPHQIEEALSWAPVLAQAARAIRENLVAPGSPEHAVWVKNRPPLYVWAAMASLLNRPYFGRVWTAQEQYLARDVDWMCGHHVLTSHEVQDFTRTITEADRFKWLLLFGASASDHEFHRHVTWLRAYAAQYNLVNSYNSLAERHLAERGESEAALLQSFAIYVSLQRTCRDPRDHVFGIMGLIAATVKSTLDVSPASSTVEVYRAFMRMLMGSTPRAAAHLEYVGRSLTFEPDLPSWTIDFRSFERYMRQPKVELETPLQDTFSDLASVTLLSRDLLQARGLRIARLQRVVSDDLPISREIVSTREMELDEIRAVMWKLFANVPACIETCGSLDAYLLLAFTEDRQREETARTMAGFLAELSQLQHGRVMDLDQPQQDWNAVFTVRDGSLHIPPEIALTATYVDFVNGHLRHSLFTTDEGRVGWASRYVQPDDILCVIYGCDLPLILRPIDEERKVGKDREDEKHERYEIIGSCIYGNMEDEVSTPWVGSKSRDGSADDGPDRDHMWLRDDRVEQDFILQ